MKQYLLNTEKNKQLLIEAFNFFTSEVFNPSLFAEILQFCKTHPILQQDVNSIKSLEHFAYKTKRQFELFITSKGIIGFTFDIPEIILEIFTNLNILQKIEANSINNISPLYKNAFHDIAQFYNNPNILFNQIFGFQYIISNYIKSVVKIENILEGKTSIGNGFIINNGAQVILTNKHVVEKYDKLILRDYDENIIPFTNITLSDDSDLALINVEADISHFTPFILNKNFDILDEVITIGYPPIPTTNASYPLCHKGEINSLVSTYWGDNLFIFSAKTNPGNSGSPIIDRNGTIIGIVAEQLEEFEGYKYGKLPYYAGIPSEEIIKFIS